MSVLDLGDQEYYKESQSMETLDTPAASRTEVFTTSVENTFRNHNPFSADMLSWNDETNRDNQYKKITGRSIYEDAGIDDPNIGPNPGPINDDVIAERKKKIDEFIAAQIQTNPEKYQGLKTNVEIREGVKNKARESQALAEKRWEGAPEGIATGAASLAGGVVASFADPVNLATLPLGAGVGRSFIKAALIEAGINMGAEVAVQPFIAEWQKELGHEYGFKEMFENVAVAGFFGAGFSAVTKGMSKVTGFTRMGQKFDELGNKEAVRATKVMEVEAHLKESDLSLGNQSLAKGQREALEEVNNAWKEGRPINTDNIPIKDRDILELNPNEIKDPVLAGKIKEFQEDVKVKEGTPIAKEGAPKLKEDNPLDAALGKNDDVVTFDQKADELANLMYESMTTSKKTGGWDGEISRFELPNESHLLHVGDRNFGMKLTMDHAEGKIPTLADLKAKIRQGMPDDPIPPKSNIPKATGPKPKIAQDDYNPLAFPKSKQIENPKNYVEATQVRAQDEFSLENINLIKKDLETLLKENPNAKMVFGDSKFTLKEIEDHFKSKEAALEAIKVCGIG